MVTNMISRHNIGSNIAISGLAIALSAGLGASVFATAVQAEPSISVYGGLNASPHSTVKYDFNQGAGPQSSTVGWDGASFKMPPYYGIRATWWFESAPAWGIAADFIHAKVVASPRPAGFAKLEFTDGINFLTANLMYRFQNESSFTPYAGIGVGLSIPSVEVVNAALTSSTKEFQIGGPAAQIFVGLDARINDNWSVFGELKSSYTRIEAELSGGGSLSTNLISNQVIFGVTYSF